MIRVGGDLGKLREWMQAVGAAPDLVDNMSRDMAEECLSLVQEGFRQQKDPYGSPWKPKKYDDGRAILVGKTARLRRGWHVVKAAAAGFVIAPSVTYARVHQKPIKSPVARRMMAPDASRGLPPEWKKRLAEVANDHLSAHFGSKSARHAGMSFVAGRLAGLKRRLNPEALLRRLIKSVAGE